MSRWTSWAASLSQWAARLCVVGDGFRGPLLAFQDWATLQYGTAMGLEEMKSDMCETLANVSQDDTGNAQCASTLQCEMISFYWNALSKRLQCAARVRGQLSERGGRRSSADRTARTLPHPGVGEKDTMRHVECFLLVRCTLQQ
jgi:hypothetical protein